ncbi:MAG: leucine-rich repeat domain-containing protein [Eubacterium sp.]|nr:leucine-rich repeat domain-containing protein [Eubacterium sp.]
MKKILLGLLVGLFALMTVACGQKSEASYCGTWQLMSVEKDGSKYTTSELEKLGEKNFSQVYMVLKEGGSAYLKDAYNGNTSSWSVEGDGLKIAEKICLYEDNFIVTDRNGSTVYFAKISDNQDITQFDEDKDDQEEVEDADDQDHEEATASPEPADESTYSEEEDFTFKKCDGDKLKITAYKGDAVEVTIPAQHDGKDVVEIEDGVFENMGGIRKVNIWANLTEIGDKAFMNCAALHEISIPNSVDSIGESAFENCSGLETVNFWGGKEIEDRAFRNCTGLKEITLASNIEEIGTEAFAGCGNLKKVTIWNDKVEIAKDAFKDCPQLEEVPE